MIDWAGIESGERRSLVKGLSLLDRKYEDENARQLIEKFLDHEKLPSIFAVIGNPGAGKSTFLSKIIESITSKDPEAKICLLLVDPADSLSGGSLLGDRVRMSEHYLNPQIFIRSLSNKLSKDGVGPSVEAMIMLCSLFGFDYIFLESVGGGQSSYAPSEFISDVIYIYDPQSGDGVQHLKSGAISNSTSIVVSKADLVPTSGVVESLKEWAPQKAEFYSPDITEKSSVDDMTLKIIQHQKGANREKIASGFLKKKILSRLERKIDKVLLNETRLSWDLVENFSIKS